MQGETVAYVQVGDRQWVFARPEKTLNLLEEILRDESQIILQNKRTKLEIRLTASQSYWKQPKDTDWTTYHRGGWGALPASVREWIEEETAEPPNAKPSDAAEDEDGASEDDYRLRVIYFIPSDRQPVRNWEAKLRVLIHFVDSFYRNDLHAKGIQTAGLQWQPADGTQQVKIHLVHGKRPAAFYNDAPKYDKQTQFQRIASEIKESECGAPGSLRLVLCETYDLGPSSTLWNGTFALGGYHGAKDGLAMFSAHIIRDEFCATTPQAQIARFFDTTPVVGRRAMGHAMNSPRREFTEDGFGAVIHELGHALGLPHDFRDHHRFIMGNGFRQLARNLDTGTPPSQRVTFSDVSTLLLSSSRFLNAKVDRSDNQAAEAELKVQNADFVNRRVKIRVNCSDSQGLRAFAIIDNIAQSPVAAGPLDGQRFQQELAVGFTPQNDQLKLTLILVDQGGNQTRVTKELSVRPNAAPAASSPAN